MTAKKRTTKEAKKKGITFKTALPVLAFFYRKAWEIQKSYFFLILLNAVLSGLSPFINILFPAYIIDELIGGRRISVLAGWVAALVLLNLSAAVANQILSYFINRANLRMEAGFNWLIGNKAMTMDFRHTESAEVLTQLQKAKDGMGWYSGGVAGITENLAGILSGLLTLSGTLAILGSLSPWLILVLVMLLLLNTYLVSRSQKLDTLNRKDMIGILRLFDYYLNLLKDFRFGKDIRLYNAAGMVLSRTDQYIQDDWKARKTVIRNGSRYDAATAGLNVVQQIILYITLGLSLLAGSITVGEAMALLNSANSFVDSLSSIIRQTITLVRNADFMNECKIFLEYPSETVSGDGKTDPGKPHVIEFRDVSFRYPEAESYALRHVSLTLEAGRRLSVVGRNGAGKTTFIKLLTRLYQPTEGQILLDGRDIREYDEEAYRALFSVVFQDFQLLSFSIKENLTATADEENLPDSPVVDALEKAGFGERLQSLEKGIHTTVYRYFDDDGSDFSGGESQKIALARAIYKNAPITILDEPTAALDPIAEYEIYTHFDNLIGGKTAIYISHRLSSCRFCERIAVFAGGEVVEYGTHDELLAKGGEYTTMWHAQAQYYV